LFVPEYAGKFVINNSAYKVTKNISNLQVKEDFFAKIVFFLCVLVKK